MELDPGGVEAAKFLPRAVDMKLSTSSIAVASAALLPGAVFAQQKTIGCSSVHIFLAKGNNEPYPGRQGVLIQAICNGLEGCDYEDIQWDNKLEDNYCGSVEQGAANGAAQIKAYNQKCPNTKLVLSGYSQGGHVIGDILGGGGGVFFQDCVQKPNPPLERSSDAGKMIVAAMIFGDTRHTASQSYNFLSGSAKNGLFPRPGDQLAGMNAYASVLRNWCVGTDPICAQGDIGETHLNYFDMFSGEAGAWVREMVEKASGAETSSPSQVSFASTTSSVVEETTTSTRATTRATTQDTTEADLTASTKAEESTTEAQRASETTSAPESMITATQITPDESTSTDEVETSESSSSKDVTTAAQAATSNSRVSDNSADEKTSSSSAAETGENGAGARILMPSIGLMGLGMVVMLGLQGYN